MPSLTIPDSAYPSIKWLLQLTEEDFQSLLTGLSDAKPALSQKNFTRHVIDKAGALEGDNIDSLMSELFSMDYIRDDLEMNGREFCDLLAKDFDFTRAGLDSGKAPVFVERLSKILTATSGLRLTTKALEVLMEEEHVFYSARILTDVRPIFTDDVKKVEAAIIVHNLRIHFGKDNAHKNFYVALDTIDIAKLREVLDRAEAKASVLQGLLQGLPVSYIDPND